MKSVSVILVNKRVSSNKSYVLKASCMRLDWQLFFVTQILTQLPPLFFHVRLPIIEKDGELPTEKEDVDPTHWLENSSHLLM